MSQENIEQERIRQIIYLNLDRLFKELNELNQKLEVNENRDSEVKKRE